MRIELAVSAGELVDRLTILELKSVRIGARVEAEIRHELSRVRAVRDRELTPSSRLDELTEALRVVNGQLWDLEESLRACERSACFGEPFVELARQVYKANDWRAALKRSIDELLGSEIREHKSHRLPDVERSAARSALDGSGAR